MNRLFFTILFLCFFHTVKAEKEPKSKHTPLFLVMENDNSGFSLYLNKKIKGEKMKLKSFIKGFAGSDYIFQPIAGKPTEGIIGFYAAGKGSIMIELSESKHIIQFDTQINKIILLKCNLDSKNLRKSKSVSTPERKP